MVAWAHRRSPRFDKEICMLCDLPFVKSLVLFLSNAIRDGPGESVF